MYDERDKPPPLMPPRMNPGAEWLRGYADAYHKRLPVIPAGLEAAAAYMKGYNAGGLTRKG